MGIYEQLRDTVSYGDELDVSHVLARLPTPPSESCAPALLEVVKRVGPEIAATAAEHLASMPHGVGMVFLMEALTEPGIRGATNIIELLRVRSLGTGWGRLGKVLANLKSKHRILLIEKLIDDATHVPPRRWKDVAMSLQSAEEVALFLDGIERICDRVEARSEEPSTVLYRAVEQAMARALLRRLADDQDSSATQQRIVGLLMRAVQRHHFIARHLMKMLAVDGACSRNTSVLTELVKVPAAITMAHATDAVGALVELLSSGDEALAGAARAALAELPGAGVPSDWLPLISLPDEQARGLALNSLAVHSGDTSAVLMRLLHDPDVTVRLEGVQLLNARLLVGCVANADAWQSYARVIAHDLPELGEALSVSSLFESAGEILRFYSAIELLATPHVELLGRVVAELLELSVWDALIPVAQHDQLASALSNAITKDPTPPEVVQGLATLLGRLPPACMKRALNLSLTRCHGAVIERAIQALRIHGDEPWRAGCELFLRLREDPVRAKGLANIKDPGLAWVAIAALEAEPVETRVYGLRLLERLNNPELVAAAAKLLEDPRPRVRRQAARTLDRLRHPDAFKALTIASRETGDPECAKALMHLTTRLTIDEAEPFSWPFTPTDPGERDSFQLWTAAAALHIQQQGIWSRLLGRKDAITPVGRLVFSEQALWQRFGAADEVVLWSNARLVVRRESLENAGRVGLIVELSELRPHGLATAGCKLWVRLSDRVTTLPVADDTPWPWIHYTERQVFLETMGWFILQYCDAEAAETIRGLQLSMS